MQFIQVEQLIKPTYDKHRERERGGGKERERGEEREKRSELKQKMLKILNT